MTTFDELRVKVGRRPITIVELDLDFCGNTYGVAPCTASVPGTGTQKCFNCFATCQDTTHFTRTSKTYKFTEANSFLPIGENVFPCISDVDIAATQLKPGAFSVSASVTVTLNDFPHHDRDIDPYVTARTYDPSQQGTFFGKLRARNPNVVNRVMRVKTGYLDADRVVYTLTRTYFIDRIEGPDANGRVRIVGKDLLRFSEIEKTKAPSAATAYLASNIGTGVTSVSVSPSGTGANYSTAGFAAIDDEILEFTRSGDTFTFSARGQLSSAAASHTASTAVQECFPYDYTERVCAKIRDLLLAAGVDSAYIPYSDWQTECDAYISTGSSHGIVASPESVKTLIEELLVSFGCALWWDELAAQIKFKVLSTGASASFAFTMDNILKDSMSVTTLEKERISRVQISYATLKAGLGSGGITLASELTPEIDNTSRSILLISTAAEGANLFGGKVTKNIVSRWIRYADVSTPNQAEKVAQRYLDRYSVAPREVKFSLDGKDSTARTGDVITITSRLLQSADGSQTPVKFIITEFREVIVGSQYQYTALELPA